MPGLLNHSSHWTFNLMERLFSALGTLEDQGSSASCSHLPSQWGKDDNSQLTVSTALWRGGLEHLVVWTVPLPVHPCCFSESSDGCEGGQDSGYSSQQKLGCCFSFCSHPKVAQYLKPSSSFLAATKGLSATFKDYDIESVGAQLSPFLFFILFVFFFPLSHPTWGWLLKGSSLWILVLAMRRRYITLRAATFSGWVAEWEKAARENGGRLVLKWRGLILNSCWLYTAVMQLTWMEFFSWCVMMSVRRET